MVTKKQIGLAKTPLKWANKECVTARDTADMHGRFVETMQDVEAAHLKLYKDLPHEQRELVSKDVEQLQKKINKSSDFPSPKKQKAVDYAESLLNECETLRTKAAMHANLKSPAPNVDFLKVLRDEPGGTKLLDDMVKGMDDKTSKNAMEAALEARFDLELKQHLSEDAIKIGTKKYHGTADKTAPGKSVKRIYELLLKVPESHAKDNPKVAHIKRFQEDTGGAWYWGKADPEIGLGCGRAGAKGSSDQGAELGSPEYFPDGVDPDCQVPDGAKKKDVRYFDWATLHEVGHAVDDKNSFMDNNQSKDAFGGWLEYGADVTKPAEAAQKKFKYDLEYIKKKLRFLNPGPSAKPGNVDQAEWDKRKAAVDDWSTLVMSERLWWEGENSKKAALEGRIYQLAYKKKNAAKNKWVSYKLAARRQGIHGYQFRAPGEWFAELYAAYYMEMLKPEHPAVKDWLPKKLK